MCIKSSCTVVKYVEPVFTIKYCLTKIGFLDLFIFCTKSLNFNHYVFQYGGEEFAHDSARFAAQKPGSSVYNADSYYLGI